MSDPRSASRTFIMVPSGQLVSVDTRTPAATPQPPSFVVPQRGCGTLPSTTTTTTTGTPQPQMVQLAQYGNGAMPQTHYILQQQVPQLQPMFCPPTPVAATPSYYHQHVVSGGTTTPMPPQPQNGYATQPPSASGTQPPRTTQTSQTVAHPIWITTPQPQYSTGTLQPQSGYQQMPGMAPQPMLLQQQAGSQPFVMGSYQPNIGSQQTQVGSQQPQQAQQFPQMGSQQAQMAHTAPSSTVSVQQPGLPQLPSLNLQHLINGSSSHRTIRCELQPLYAVRDFASNLVQQCNGLIQTFSHLPQVLQQPPPPSVTQISSGEGSASVSEEHLINTQTVVSSTQSSQQQQQHDFTSTNTAAQVKLEPAPENSYVDTVILSSGAVSPAEEERNEQQQAVPVNVAKRSGAEEAPNASKRRRGRPPVKRSLSDLTVQRWDRPSLFSVPKAIIPDMVTAIRDHPVIWDSDHPRYGDIDATNVAWNDVEELFPDLGVKRIQNLWSKLVEKCMLDARLRSGTTTSVYGFPVSLFKFLRQKPTDNENRHENTPGKRILRRRHSAAKREMLNGESELAMDLTEREGRSALRNNGSAILNRDEDRDSPLFRSNEEQTVFEKMHNLKGTASCTGEDTKLREITLHEIGPIWDGLSREIQNQKFIASLNKRNSRSPEL